MTRFERTALLFLLTLSSCIHHDSTFDEKNKIFYAGPSEGGVSGGLSLELFIDSNYLICNNGGMLPDCYEGKYSLNNDTLTLLDFDSSTSLKYNRLILFKYDQQDSMYWKWKYDKYTYSDWADFKLKDQAIGGIGDVYQVNPENIVARKEYHLIIRFDSLNFH